MSPSSPDAPGTPTSCSLATVRTMGSESRERATTTRARGVYTGAPFGRTTRKEYLIGPWAKSEEPSIRRTSGPGLARSDLTVEPEAEAGEGSRLFDPPQPAASTTTARARAEARTRMSLVRVACSQQ